MFYDIDSIIANLCNKSEQTTGCSNWGEESFKNPLKMYLSSVAKSANLHERGQAILLKNAARLLENRLLLQQRIENVSFISKNRIQNPLFIIGMPRTGSTLLHNLLSCDNETRTLKYYEGLRPISLLSKNSEEARIRAAQRQIKIRNKTMPGYAAMHAVKADGPEECLTLLENSFVDSIFEVRANVPDYSQWLQRNEDSACYYEEFHRILQVLGDYGKKRWVCKSPRHMMCLKSIVEVFPDAKIIWTHRNPLNVLPSISSLSEAVHQVGSDHVDRNRLGEFWLQRLSEGIEKAKKFRAADDPSRYVDVRYSDLVANPKKIVKKIYDHHKLGYSDDLDAAMTQWLVENPKNKHGKHSYTLEKYGLTKEKVYERLEFIPDDERHIYLDEKV